MIGQSADYSDEIIVLSDLEYDELARVLLGDIHTLVPLAFSQGRPVSEAHIRLLAVIMRRWLVDGDLKKLLAQLRQSALFNVQGNNEAKAYLSSFVHTNTISFFRMKDYNRGDGEFTVYEAAIMSGILMFASHVIEQAIEDMSEVVKNVRESR